MQELDAAVKHVHQTATRMSVATDLQTRTGQATYAASVESQLKRQQDYMQDVVQQLQRELRTRKAQEEERSAEIAELRNTVVKEQQERRSLQDYIDDIHASLISVDMEVDQVTGPITWDHATDELGLPVLPSAQPVQTERLQHRMHQATPPRVDYSVSIPMPQPVLDFKPDVILQPHQQ